MDHMTPEQLIELLDKHSVNPRHTDGHEVWFFEGTLNYTTLAEALEAYVQKRIAEAMEETQ